MNHPIESLVHREARLLDQGLLDEWLALYAADATYWIPIDENADPLKQSSIVFDNRLRLAMRVEQIMRQHRVGQTPASATMRLIGNLEVQQTSDRDAQARFSQLAVEVRSGDWRQNGLGETRLFPGHCEMNLRLDGAAWQITHKKIVLLNRRQPIVGLSFML